MTIDRMDPQGRVATHHRVGSGLVRVGYPIGVRTVKVVARQQLTPAMIRLTLAGPGLADLHTYQCDDHVAVVFPDPGGELRIPVANDHQMLDWPHPMPPTRKYTIRRFDARSLQVDLDVVLHDGGLASTWASTVGIGAEVTIAGPPGSKAFAHNYDHYVFAVDATGLPPLERWLAAAPPDVSADIVIETASAAEHGYPLPERRRVRVSWLTRGDHSRLARTVENLALPAGRVFLFAAGEAGDIKPLRSWRADIDSLVTGYWKRGEAGFHD
ncbi:MAG: siderophore-interacting protein [Nakamurella sp.]